MVVVVATVRAMEAMVTMVMAEQHHSNMEDMEVSKWELMGAHLHNKNTPLN